MYAFSVTATAQKEIDDYQVGDQALFIVYIHFKDLFGAEALCKLFLMREGFGDVVIEKRQPIGEDKLQDPRIVQADKALAEALSQGYALQLFSH